MQRSFSRLTQAAVLIVAFASAAGAAAQERTQQREQVRARVQERAGHREIIPGSELMTAAEREAYRQRYAAAKTDADRDKVRADHITAMEERARLRGLKLAIPVVPAGAGK
jgi:hypothetical protein